MESQFCLEEQIIILSTPTINKILLYENGGDLIALYVFYYYTAKWQKTNQPKATAVYCQKGLHWGEVRFRTADKILIELGLIKKVYQRGKTGRINSWYVRLNYIWTKEKEDTINPYSPENHVEDFEGEEDSPQPHEDHRDVPPASSGGKPGDDINELAKLLGQKQGLL